MALLVRLRLSGLACGSALLILVQKSIAAQTKVKLNIPPLTLPKLVQSENESVTQEVTDFFWLILARSNCFDLFNFNTI